MRIPAMAVNSMTRHTMVPIAISGHGFVGLVEPNTASTLGPRFSTQETVPIMVAATISQPVTKPKYGLIARPTHSKDAPQLAFHLFSRRYALAMISIGIAVIKMISPLL